MCTADPGAGSAPCATRPPAVLCWGCSAGAALRQRGHRAALQRCSFGAEIWRKQGCALQVGAAGVLGVTEPQLPWAARSFLKLA